MPVKDETAKCVLLGTANTMEMLSLNIRSIVEVSTAPTFFHFDAEPSATQVVAAESYTYTADDLCGEPGRSQGWRDPGYFHSGVIKVKYL